jgi:hypothetical protein
VVQTRPGVFVQFCLGITVPSFHTAMRLSRTVFVQFLHRTD